MAQIRIIFGIVREEELPKEKFIFIDDFEYLEDENG